jgi:hypothetical protein
LGVVEMCGAKVITFGQEVGGIKKNHVENYKNFTQFRGPTFLNCKK